MIEEGVDNSLWAAVVSTERHLIEDQAQFNKLGSTRTRIISLALASADSWNRTAALHFLQSFTSDIPQLMPELLRLSISNRWASYARETIASASPSTVRPVLETTIWPLLEDADADTYQRLTEVVARVEAWSILGRIINIGLNTSDTSIAEVCDELEQRYGGFLKN